MMYRVMIQRAQWVRMESGTFTDIRSAYAERQRWETAFLKYGYRQDEWGRWHPPIGDETTSVWVDAVSIDTPTMNDTSVEAFVSRQFHLPVVTGGKDG
jgi:hypothetical protein